LSAGGELMVSKCANPLCSASFRYLHTGKLFRFDAKHSSESTAVRLPRNGAELFWLCNNCVEEFTIVWDPAEGARTIRLGNGDLRRAS
jgi:hypothetical protein